MTRRKTIVAVVLLAVLVALGAAAAWRFYDQRPTAGTAAGAIIRSLMMDAINSAVPLGELAALDLNTIRSQPGGEPAWREDVDAAIVDLGARINAVTGNPGVDELSQRSRFMFTRLPARLEKLRDDTRRRAATIEQSACAVVLQGVREVAALDGELPENCVGIGRDDCDKFIRGYLTVLALPADTCS